MVKKKKNHIKYTIIAISKFTAQLIHIVVQSPECFHLAELALSPQNPGALISINSSIIQSKDG